MKAQKWSASQVLVCPFEWHRDGLQETLPEFPKLSGIASWSSAFAVVALGSASFGPIATNRYQPITRPAEGENPSKIWDASSSKAWLQVNALSYSDHVNNVASNHAGQGIDAQYIYNRFTLNTRFRWPPDTHDFVRQASQAALAAAAGHTSMSVSVGSTFRMSWPSEVTTVASNSCATSAT